MSSSNVAKSSTVPCTPETAPWNVDIEFPNASAEVAIEFIRSKLTSISVYALYTAVPASTELPSSPGNVEVMVPEVGFAFMGVA